MSLQDGTTSRDPGRRGRARHAPSARPTAVQRDGVLVLVPTEQGNERDPLSRLAMAHDAMLDQLRVERDAALEEVAFLREQLRSARAYHVHELEEHRAHLHAERALLLRQLAMLRERLRSHESTTPASDGERMTDEGADANAPR